VYQYLLAAIDSFGVYGNEEIAAVGEITPKSFS
jgi:hypothetical protein